MRSLSVLLTAAGVGMSFAAGVLHDAGALAIIGVPAIVTGVAGVVWSVLRGWRYDRDAGHHLTDHELVRLGVDPFEPVLSRARRRRRPARAPAVRGPRSPAPASS